MSSRIIPVVGAVTLTLFAACYAFSQAALQPTAVAGKAMAALTNGVSLVDVTLTANVTRTVGSDTQTGTATLMAAANGKSRVDLDLDSGKISEIRDSVNGVPVGAWISPSGKKTPFAGQNCLTDAAWFFPAFTAISASDPSIVLSSTGTEQRKGTSVYHLRSYRNSSALAAQFTQPQGVSNLAKFSASELYIDSATSLPIALTFNTHPDNNQAIDISMEVDYSNYQAVNGIMVPFHIQEYMQGVLLLDFQVTSVAMNTGVPSNSFSVR